MDILICNGKLTCNKSSKLSFNVLFRTLYHYAYTLKTVNLPSTVLSWCAVIPKWCFELQGRLKRKLMKMQMTWEKFLENSKAPWHTDQAGSTRVWASHAHPRAATQACTPRTVSEAQSRSHTDSGQSLEASPARGTSQPLRASHGVNAAATVYSLLPVCRVSQLVLHNHDLILFFQQPHLVKLQYHFTDKKTEVCFITRLPPWKRQQGHLYPHHTCFLRASFPMSVGIKFGFILDPIPRNLWSKHRK